MHANFHSTVHIQLHMQKFEHPGRKCIILLVLSQIFIQTARRAQILQKAIQVLFHSTKMCSSIKKRHVACIVLIVTQCKSLATLVQQLIYSEHFEITHTRCIAPCYSVVYQRVKKLIYFYLILFNFWSHLCGFKNNLSYIFEPILHRYG